MLNTRAQALLAHFRCPHCRQPGLSVRGESLYCDGCGAVYEIRRGVPRLLSNESQSHARKELGTHTGSAMVAEYTGTAPVDHASPFKGLIDLVRPPELLLHTNPDLRAPHTRALFERDGKPTRVLNVGGGPRRYSDHELTLNIEAFPNVDMVADAHNLPFEDNTFDAVFSVAVLEHVYSPEQVVAEMIRVLKPGGVLYSEVPFIFFFHGYPNDFRRYTREGMRRLCEGLDELQIGMQSGPVSAALQSLNMALQMLLPSRPQALRKLFNGIYRWLLFPFKYLDIPLIRHHPDAHILAAGFHALGRKPAARPHSETRA